MAEEEINYDLCPINELLELYERKVDEFKQCNASANFLVDPKAAPTLARRAHGNTSRSMLMSKAKKVITS